MSSLFSIHSTSSSRELVFSNRNGENFSVELKGDVTASVDVWVYTDSGFLCDYFQDLATSENPWKGVKKWCSIEGEFGMSASCSSLGDVLFIIDLHGLPGAPEEWRLSVGLETEFGQLPSIARGVSRFFE